MKKIISMIMVLCMLAAMFAINTSAAGITTDAPDWIITEIGCDQTGDGTGGWTNSLDPFEYFELYNNSGKTLNLYDYGMFYNGYKRSTDNFETVVVEYTPFLPGNYFDGWTGAADEWTFTGNAYCGLENIELNPDTCMVEPGECVVIWSRFRSSFFADWNNGKGMQIADFRNFYNIPESVKVISWDGNNYDDGAGGHVKNFTPKNSAVGTYGVCLKSDILNAEANQGTTAAEALKGSWTENVELISWATVDLTTQVTEGCVGNMAFNFVLDNKEIGAKEFYYDFDIRREMLVEKNVEPTPGSLTTLQKMWLGVALDANETLIVGDTTFYAPYSETGEFAGLKINDTLYKTGDTFTASAAGVYTIDYAYGKQAEDTTTAAPDTTEAPADTTTAAPEADTTTAAPEADTTTAAPEADTTTAAPTTNAPTTEAPKSEGGCGGFVALGIVAALIPAAIVVCKKRD